MTWRVVVALVLLLSLAGSALAQEAPPPDESQAPPPEEQAPAGPALQPSDLTPLICDPAAAGFRYLEVRGTGFDAWATQRLMGNVVDANGLPQIHWGSVWVTPQGRLTLEVNLCSDPVQHRPALPAGDYSVSVGDNSGATIAETGISLAAPPDTSGDTSDQTAPGLSSATPVASPTSMSYVIPSVQAQPSATPLPVVSFAAPTPTSVPRRGPGSVQQPYPLGAPGMLVDGWQLVITGVTPDAYEGIKASILSAIAPASDQRDLMVRAQATYVGPGTGVFSGARLALLSGIQTTYDQIRNSCGAIPDMLPPNVVTSGTTVRGNICFVVRASDIGSLVLFDNQTSEADRVYFALQ